MLILCMIYTGFMKIGVFDSGIGGKAVAELLSQAFPDAQIDYVHDSEHMPYGNRSAEDVRQLTDTAIQPLLGSDVIVIACNTATALAIDWLRDRYPDQLFIGLEPMIKPAAALTRSGIITVCATPATLASERYHSLKGTYAADITILEPDCSDWARMIEHKSIDDQKIINMVRASAEQHADVIVLACTHYHWIREQIEQSAGPDVTVLDPSRAIVARILNILEQYEQAQ